MLKNLLVYGGKGGVGKSSISTATAVYLADQLPDQKVLLISFDVAHNLSDLFQRPIGTDLIQITDNLWAIEPDPDTYANRYAEVFAKKTRQLLDTMPLIGLIPDLEKFVNETFRAKSIPLALKNALFFQSVVDADHPMDLLEEGAKEMGKELTEHQKTEISEHKGDQPTPLFDVIVADMPPTGNMVALFEVPEDTMKNMLKYSLQMVASVQGFVQKLNKVKKVMNPLSWFKDDKKKDEQKNLAQDILTMLHGMEARGQRIYDLMKGIGSLRLVTIAEKPSVEEIKRAWEMSMPYISLDAVHINRLLPPELGPESSFLQKQITLQQKYSKMVFDGFSEFQIYTSKYLDTEPIGMEGLRILAKEIYKDAKVESVLNPLNRKLVYSSENIEKKAEQKADTNQIKIEDEKADPESKEKSAELPDSEENNNTNIDL